MGMFEKSQEALTLTRWGLVSLLQEALALIFLDYESMFIARGADIQ